MLRSRRLLAFSSRVHTYTLLLYVFFFIVYILSGYFAVEAAFIDLLLFYLTLVGWTNLLFGFWVLIFSLIVYAGAGILPVSEIVLTIIRMATVYTLSLVATIVENILSGGVTIG